MYFDLTGKAGNDSATTTLGRMAISYGRFMQADPIGYLSGMNLYAYVLNDPINLVDPSGLYPVCRLIDTTHTTPSGDVVVSSKIDCYDNGQEITPIDTLVVNWVIGHLQPGHEQLFSAFDDHVIPVKPDTMTVCEGSDVVTYRTSLAAFQGGIPGHIHGPNFAPGLGPDDGVAARVAGGTAYVGGTADVYRVDRLSATSYSVSLLRGSWGMPQQGVISLIGNWNQFDGQNAQSLASQGGASGNAAGCTTTPVGN